MKTNATQWNAWDYFATRLTRKYDYAALCYWVYGITAQLIGSIKIMPPNQDFNKKFMTHLFILRHWSAVHPFQYTEFLLFVAVFQSVIKDLCDYTRSYNYPMQVEWPWRIKVKSFDV